MRSMEIHRVARTHQQARLSYDSLSRWYDLLSGASERKYKEKGLELLHVREGERVLEIGSGTGACLNRLSEAAGDQGLVAGIDLSPGMLRVALRKLKPHRSLRPVRFTKTVRLAGLVCSDALGLPFPAASFDALFLSFTLELFDTPEIPLALAECRRVLKAGGRLCVVSLAKKDTWVVRLYERIHDLWPAAVDCRPIYPAQALAEAGLHIEQVVEMLMFGLPVEVVLALRG